MLLDRILEFSLAGVVALLLVVASDMRQSYIEKVDQLEARVRALENREAGRLHQEKVEGDVVHWDGSRSMWASLGTTSTRADTLHTHSSGPTFPLTSGQPTLWIGPASPPKQ